MLPIRGLLSRKGRWFRPFLELLEKRLPPGDTFLGLVVPGALFESTLSDASFILHPSSFPNDSSFILHPSSLDSLPLATWPTRETSWPGSPVAASPSLSTSSVNSTDYLATWPHTTQPSWPPAQRIAQGRATTQLSAVASAFPNSGSVFSGPQAPPGNPLPRGSASQYDAPTRQSLFPARAQAEPGHEGAHAPITNRSSGTRAAGENYGSLPFYFEQNFGQADAAFDFVARGSGYTLGLSATEAIMAMPAQNSESRIQNSELNANGWEKAGLLPDGRRIGEDRSEPGPGPVVRMQLIGGNAAAPVAGVDQLVTKINYFLGNDPNQWHSNVATFAKVQYDDVYPGIDLVYYSNQNQLEYDFVVSPGADPNQIALTFSGADSVQIDANGDLVLQTGDTEIRQNAPHIYQEINGTRQQVAGEFRIQNSECSASTDYCLLTTVYFDVGQYDPTRPLVIDPIWLAYSTYLGGQFYDYANDIAVDQFGSAYIAGEAGSGLPLVNPQQTYGGGKDAYVAKFAPDGQSLLYATYLGGSYQEQAYGIALDVTGAAYITGVTHSGNFPVTAGAFQPANGHGTCQGFVSCADAFVTKLSPSGSELMYSTYLGVGNSESADAIAVDSAGNAYVIGQTKAPNFYTVNAVQPVFGGGSCNGGNCYDAFVTKFNSTGSALVYSTFLGGNRDEARFFGDGGSIAVDPAGHAYVTGYTESYNFPTHNALQLNKKGPVDAYVTKLSTDGTAFVYSTYLGGTGGELGRGIIADPSGYAYVTGKATSDDFPTTPGAFQAAPAIEGDAFVSKFRPDGSALVYSTLLGGSTSDQGDDIAVDRFGNTYITGYTYSPDFPIQHPFQARLSNDPDAFISKLSFDGRKLIYSSYLGGTDAEGADGVSVDSAGNAYIAGSTQSTDFPLVKPYQLQNSGNRDAFVAKVGRFLRETPRAEQVAP